MYTNEQIRANRLAWIEALESGKYTQTKSRLYLDGHMCCLGVACDISGLGRWTAPEDQEDGDVGYCIDFVIDMFELPYALQDWLGTSDANPWMDGYSAATWNDSHGSSFAQIAAHARKEWDLPKGTNV